MPPRSTRLAYGNASPNVVTTVYTVASGLTSIVKSVGLHNQGSVAATVFIYTSTAGGAFNAALFTPAALGANAGWYQDMWIVLESGDQLLIFCTQTNSYWVSGAELATP